MPYTAIKRTVNNNSHGIARVYICTGAGQEDSAAGGGGGGGHRRPHKGSTTGVEYCKC